MTLIVSGPYNYGVDGHTGSLFSPQLMNQLDIGEGDLVVVDNASLPLATYSKFEPQSKEFLDISNPKAVYPLHILFLFVCI